MPNIIYRLLKISLGIRNFDRVRFAVTNEEYEEIRSFLLCRDGRFYRRIRNVPLVVEDYPDNPPSTIEFR